MDGCPIQTLQIDPLLDPSTSGGVAQIMETVAGFQDRLALFILTHLDTDASRNLARKELAAQYMDIF